MIVGIDPVTTRREASQRVGATHVIDPGTDDPVARVRELTSGRGADFSFEVVGRVELMAQAVEMTRRAGTVTFVGMPPVDAVLSLPAFGTLFSGKRIVGSVMGGAQVLRDFPRFIGLAESGRLDLGSLVSSRISLEDINKGIDAAHDAEGVRTVIV